MSLENEEGTKFIANTYQSKRVWGVSYENSNIMLMVGDKKCPDNVGINHPLSRLGVIRWTTNV